MKLTIFLLLISGASVLASKSYSQTKTLTVNMNNATVREVLEKIEEQSEFYFMYSEKVIDVNREVSVDINNQNIKTALNLLFNGTNVDYTIKDRIIVLTTPEVFTEKSIDEIQQKAVSGKVTDEAGKPLPGVTVVTKGTTQGTVSNGEGEYFLTNISENATLVFSFVGMISQEIVVAGQTNINIQMQPETIGIEEVVAIGYGTVKRSDLTGSVMRVDADALKSQSKTQLTDMIAGTVAGFYIKQEPSASGGASSMEIRGQNSLLANTEPLIVLDGIIYNGNIMDINPNDIETIDILKDASSTAVYGARAASGVVIINTTKGATGKPRINVTTTIGISETARDIKPFDAEGFLNFRRDYLEMSDPHPDYYFYNPNELPESVTVEQWRNYSANPHADNTQEWLGRLLLSNTETQNYLDGKSVNWYDEVMQVGLRQNYDVSLSGGTDNASYYWSVGYTDNEGIVVGDKFSTIRSRLNFEMNVADFIDVGINTQFSSRDQSQVTANMNNMFIVPPYGSMYNEDGSLKWEPSEQPIAPNPFMDYTYQDKFNKTNSLFASLYSQLNLPLGFSYRISFQPHFKFGQNYIFNPTTNKAGSGSRSDTKTFGWILDNLIKWNKKIGIHDFDLTLLYSVEKNQYWSSFASNKDFSPNENLSYHGLQFGIYPSLISNDTYSTGDAAMARLNYILLGKYLLTASVRRDGYSAFGQANPRATFPAAALAWRISEEDFFKVNWISQMKLRVSWGINGNRDIGIYSALATLSSNYYYDGSSAVVGVTADGLANPSLVWEKTQATNMGIDIGLFSNRVNLSADYYISTTKDLLMNRRLPVMTGFSDMTVNLGELANRGFEMTINTTNISTPKLNWKSNLVFSFNRNEIVKLYGDYGSYKLEGKDYEGELPDYINEWFIGQPIDVVWDYDVTGVWQLDESDEVAKVGLRPGDYKAVDVNEDDLYTELEDKKFIGYSKPRFNIGFRNDFSFLKNFTASIFVRADLGHISPLGIAQHGNNNMYDRLNDRDVPYWTQYNPNNVWGRLDPFGGVYAGGYGVYFSRSFVRIQDLTLSYNFPQEIVRRMKLNNARIYGSVRNLYSFDKWEDFDPESGSSPMPRTFTLGFSFEL